MIRIVKMTFKPELVPHFLELFEANKERIRSFPGCTRLELLREINQPERFFTYSWWNAPSDLENYRNSELFASVWSRTKALFSEKPDAWSVNQEVILP